MTARDDKYNSSDKGKARNKRRSSKPYRLGYQAGYKAGKTASDIPNTAQLAYSAWKWTPEAQRCAFIGCQNRPIRTRITFDPVAFYPECAEHTSKP